MFRLIFSALLAFLANASVLARELTVSTWNMGWHLSQAEAQTWIGRCGGKFVQDATGKWMPTDGDGTPAWQLKWGRDFNIDWDLTVFPPCDVFKDDDFHIVAVTPAAYANRAAQIQKIIAEIVEPDIIAFEEVSGEQAVRELLPNQGQDYNICSFANFKVQRLAFAWKKELGNAEECVTEEALSLPGEAIENRVRPGLSVALRIDGNLVRLLAVHLKSGCVSPLDENHGGDLSGSEQPCQLKQKQIVPLEKWIEKKSADASGFLVLGDFNRNLWHEQNWSGDIRTDQSDPATDLPDGVKVIDLLKEMNDGAPVSSRLTLLREVCPLNDFTKSACKTAEGQILPHDDAKKLTSKDNMGCRNAVGLDHILIGAGVGADLDAEKVSLGKFGRTLPANGQHPEPLLAVSDHCPLKAKLSLPEAKAQMKPY